ncbi:hypothetical protein [Persicobacter diffluens]|uniref:hypothetical protein n=1 Tax=Persicobacter diffluens TaxID=981 RepID=UPI0030C724B6
MGIDKPCLSNCDLYAILLSAKGRKRSIVAIIKGTKSEKIIHEIRQIPKSLRDRDKEITAYLSPSMI